MRDRELTNFPKTNGGRLVRRGRTFDFECGRTTHRLRQAAALLKGLGVEPTYPEHDERCILNPANRHNRVFGFSYGCECGVGTDPTPTWPEWATGETFDLAYRLADEVQTNRGAYNRAKVTA